MKSELYGTFAICAVAGAAGAVAAEEHADGRGAAAVIGDISHAGRQDIGYFDLVGIFRPVVGQVQGVNDGVAFLRQGVINRFNDGQIGKLARLDCGLEKIRVPRTAAAVGTPSSANRKNRP